MRIAFGATVLARGLQHGGVDGIGSYTRQLLARLPQDPQIDLVPFAYDGPVAQCASQPLVRVGSFERQALVSLATGMPFARLGRSLGQGVDLVHATDHLIPRLSRIPVVATLMDAIPLAHPEWVTYRLKRTKNLLWRRTAAWADHVVTISEHSRGEIARWFRVPPERISVIPLGVSERWFEEPSLDEIERVRQTYDLPGRFLLFVGTLQPRKNLGRLIAAHALLPAALRREVPLVVVGRAGWACDEEVARLTDGDQGALRWLRYVPDADLMPLLRQATALVLPSLHEGFGLPVLEAFAAAVPVIASNTTALPEVAGDAALLVDPANTGDIADALRQLAANDALREELRARGRARAREFTWDRTAHMTADIYRQVLGGSN